MAVAFGHKVLGPIGSFLLALIVAGSCFGALNASLFTSGRLVYAAGKEGYFPSVFGKIGIGNRTAVRLGSSTRSGKPNRFARGMNALIADDAGLFFTPINAILLNTVLCAIYVTVGEFSTLLTFYGVAGYTFYFFTVLGLIILRVREPLLERPYKTWITTPIIFCCVSLFLLSRAVFADPFQTLLVIAFTVAGVPVYWFRVRRRGKRVNRRGEGDAEKGVGWKFWRRWGRG